MASELSMASYWIPDTDKDESTTDDKDQKLFGSSETGATVSIYGTNTDVNPCQESLLVAQLIKCFQRTVDELFPELCPPHTQPRPGSPEKMPEICLSHIWKHCSREDNCPNMHYYLPYRWQRFNGTHWEDLPNMEDIEKTYSEPGKDRHDASEPDGASASEFRWFVYPQKKK